VSPVRKIVSGGQTGADRAGLDVAIELEIPHGGWCPRGRRTEDGPLPDRYQLTETDSSSYTQRTAWNVRDSDATVVFTLGTIGPGSRNTLAVAHKLGRSHLHIDLSLLLDATSCQKIESLQRWLTDCDVHTLNVAGSRESTSPGIGQAVTSLLRAALR